MFRLDPRLGSVVAMSFVGGYPVGASLISDLVRRGEVSENSAAIMMCFCCNAGPAFVITAVGVQFFGSAKFGLVLLVSHMLASLLMGWVLSFRQPKPKASRRGKEEPSLGYSQAFVEAVASASSSILMICAYVVLFSAVLALLSDSGILPGAAAALSMATGLEESFFTSVLGGLLEVTTGCAALVQAKVGSPLVLASFFLSFSGISIHMQIRHCFRGLRVSLRPFFISRLAGALLSAGITWGAIAAVPSGRGRGALLLLSAHAWNECAFLLRHGVPGYFVQPVFNEYLSGYLRHILQAGEAPGGEKPQRSLTGAVPGVFLSSML